jgi:flagellar basal body rod protein FlgC
MKQIILILLAFATLIPNIATSQSKGSAVKLNGTNGIIDCGNIVELNNTTYFTIEFWFYLNSWSNFSDLFNKGNDIILIQGNQTGKIGIMIGTTSQVDIIDRISLNEWTHIAVSYDGTKENACERADIYINGRKANIADSDCETAPQTPSNDLSLRIGSGHHAPESNNIIIDEVKVWKTKRSQEEIREFMCQKPFTNDENLIAYYNFDEITDFVVPDLSQNSYNANLINVLEEEIIFSDAPVGDISEYLYLSDWIEEEVCLDATEYAKFCVKNISFGIEAVYLYQVNSVPYNSEGLLPTENSDSFWGVYLSPKFGASAPRMYSIIFDYSNHQSLVLNESDLILAGRASASANYWAATNATINTDAKTISIDSICFDKPEFFPAVLNQACEKPQNINYTINGDDVNFSWSSGNSIWDIEYGESGFNLGTGNRHSISQNQIQISPEINSLYDFYVRSKCDVDSSIWTGPYVFFGNRCSEVANISISQIQNGTIEIEFIGSNAEKYNLKWGLSPVNFDWAILTSNISQNPHTINGLLTDRTYQFYVQSACQELLSAWVGPFSYTTVSSNVDSHLADNTIIYPNPSENKITIYDLPKNTNRVEILSTTGQNLFLMQTDNIESNLEININDFQNGLYLLKISSQNKTIIRRFVKF